MGVFFQEVMLNFPGIVVPQLIRQFDLSQRILIQVAFGELGPRAWAL